MHSSTPPPAEAGQERRRGHGDGRPRRPRDWKTSAVPAPARPRDGPRVNQRRSILSEETSDGGKEIESMHLLAPDDLWRRLEVARDERLELEAGGTVNVLDGVEVMRFAPGNLHQHQVV